MRSCVACGNGASQRRPRDALSGDGNMQKGRLMKRMRKSVQSRPRLREEEEEEEEEEEVEEEGEEEKDKEEKCAMAPMAVEKEQSGRGKWMG